MKNDPNAQHSTCSKHDSAARSTGREDQSACRSARDNAQRSSGSENDPSAPSTGCADAQPPIISTADKTPTVVNLESNPIRTSHHGKIARCPAAVREGLNRRLYDGEGIQD